MWQAVRTGDWLTAERLRGYALILAVASGLLLAFVHATADGVLDYKGRPLGTDFSQVWVAGGWCCMAQPAEPYDNERHRALQKQAFGPEAEFYAWLYPPFFLAPAAALALLPYWPALMVWLGATLAALPRGDAGHPSPAGRHRGGRWRSRPFSSTPATAITPSSRRH